MFISNHPYGCNIVFDRNRFFASWKGMEQGIYFCIMGKSFTFAMAMIQQALRAGFILIQNRRREKYSSFYEGRNAALGVVEKYWLHVTCNFTIWREVERMEEKTFGSIRNRTQRNPWKSSGETGGRKETNGSFNKKSLWNNWRTSWVTYIEQQKFLQNLTK